MQTQEVKINTFSINMSMHSEPDNDTMFFRNTTVDALTTQRLCCAVPDNTQLPQNINIARQNYYILNKISKKLTLAYVRCKGQH